MWRWIVVLAALTWVSPAWAKTDIIAGPMVGHVTHNSARLWMQLSTTEAVTLRCFDVDRNRQVGGEITIDVSGPAPFILDAPVSALEPNRSYRVEILFDGKPVKLPEPAVVIRTAPPPGAAANWTLAFGSCLDPAAFPQMPVFKAIEAISPRAFLFIGDCGYLPSKIEGFPEKRRDAFRFLCDQQKTVRNAPDLQGILRTIAVYGVWDDHDFGTDNADKSFPFAKESQVAWQRYWANPGYGEPEKDNPAVYFSFTIGDVDIFMLDDRMFRDADNDPSRKTMLGDMQLAWLKQGLLASTAPFKIIANGSQMLTTDTGWDTWGNYKAERDGFIKWIFANKIGGVMFLSGDRHFGEITVRKPEVGDASQYPLVDMTSSPLAQKIADPAEWKVPNPDRVGALVDEINFGTVEFGGPVGKRHATLRLRDAKGAAKVEKVVFAEELKGQ